MRRKIFRIGIVLVSMLTIFLFSSENANNSTKTSKSFVREILSIVIKDEVIVERIVNNEFVVYRKIAHITEFFLLGFLLTNLLVGNKSSISFKYVILATIVAGIYAASDELHQTMVIGRSGEFIDVLIDSGGSFLGALSFFGIFKYFKGKNK